LKKELLLVELTKHIATYLSSISYENLSSQAIYNAKRGIIDYIGVTLGGSEEQESNSVSSVLAGAGGKSSIFGREGRYDLLNAALINGIQGHILDFDDTHEETTTHITVPCLSAALALAEDRNLSGEELITAYVTGYEASVIIGELVNSSHYENGWHATGTLGSFAAAVATASLLGYDAEKIEKVIGICTTQLAGVRSVFGSSGKSLNSGKAAYNGLLSTLLVEAGFGGQSGMLERPNGFISVYSNDRLDGMNNFLLENDNKYKIEENAVKAYSCGLLTHGAIDAVLTIKEKYSLQLSDITSLEFHVHPLAEDNTGIVGIVNPQTPLEGKFSLRFCAAASFVIGKPLNSLFTIEAIENEEVRRLMELVEVKIDPKCSKTGATLYVQTVDGNQLEQQMPNCKGTPSNPMSDKELEEKFIDLTKGKMGEHHSLLEHLWNIEKCSELNSIMNLIDGKIQKTTN
jgi:2-methylcitrate dehydratase PrpD